MTRGQTRFDPDALRKLRSAYTDAAGRLRPLSAEALGAMIGASKSQVLAYEHGRHVPDPKRVRALAKALGVLPEQLMLEGGREAWDVADIRRASGLRARDVLDALGVSPKSYRRFEVQGIVPARRPRFLDDVASAIRISYSDLDKAMNNIPQVKFRRRRCGLLIWNLAEKYVYPPGPWIGPSTADEEIAEISSLYGRPPQRIRRILSHSLEDLRHKLLRLYREQVVAQYDLDPARQNRALAAVDTWNDLFHGELGIIPENMERFHRSAQSSDGWQALIDLSESEAAGPDGPWVLTAVLPDAAAAASLSPFLIRRKDFRGLLGIQLTPAGQHHVRRFTEFYAALFPTLRRPRPPARGYGNARAIRLGFGGVNDIRQDRLVIPPRAYESLAKRADPSGGVVLPVDSLTQLVLNLSATNKPVTVDLATGGGPR
ncbi:helix-turn-helix domain-containing protein [Streptomyces sp. NPDC015501]|uniref:helix-turn-helix domain-containing protein n=1 Tax=unclassified Streptomyces TaxID=2593676 RepID=UPI0011A238CF